MKPVLCIGGLDPAGRAGLLADARAVEAMGARALCAAAALTFQSSLRVDGFEPVRPEALAAQLRTLLRDEPVAAVKLGQLGTPENAQVVYDLVAHLPTVVDTPLVSTSGAELFPVARAKESYAPLLARAVLVTPNLAEVRLLAGRPDGDPDAEGAARDLGARAVLLKGGHAQGERVTDVLLTPLSRREYSSPRIEGRFRGTGCRLASAIAARLALGDRLEEAVEEARRWLVGRLYFEAHPPRRLGTPR